MCHFRARSRFAATWPWIIARGLKITSVQRKHNVHAHRQELTSVNTFSELLQEGGCKIINYPTPLCRGPLWMFEFDLTKYRFMRALLIASNGRARCVIYGHIQFWECSGCWPRFQSISRLFVFGHDQMKVSVSWCEFYFSSQHPNSFVPHKCIITPADKIMAHYKIPRAHRVSFLHYLIFFSLSRGCEFLRIRCLG